MNTPPGDNHADFAFNAAVNRLVAECPPGIPPDVAVWLVRAASELATRCLSDLVKTTVERGLKAHIETMERLTGQEIGDACERIIDTVERLHVDESESWRNGPPDESE